MYADTFPLVLWFDVAGWVVQCCKIGWRGRADSFFGFRLIISRRLLSSSDFQYPRADLYLSAPSAPDGSLVERFPSSAQFSWKGSGS